jgi:hypothetical protein
MREASALIKHLDTEFGISSGRARWLLPPWGEIRPRLEWAWGFAEVGATVVCLVPARTDTRWWFDYCRHGEVRSLRGRLRFGAGAGAPFPSAVVILGRPPSCLLWDWWREAQPQTELLAEKTRMSLSVMWSER